MYAFMFGGFNEELKMIGLCGGLQDFVFLSSGLIRMHIENELNADFDYWGMLDVSIDMFNQLDSTPKFFAVNLKTSEVFVMLFGLQDRVKVGLVEGKVLHLFNPINPWTKVTVLPIGNWRKLVGKSEKHVIKAEISKTPDDHDMYTIGRLWFTVNNSVKES